MSRRAPSLPVLACALLLSASSPTLHAGEETRYPESRKVDHVDDYHGTSVADPYRWLEDGKSDETQAWLAQLDGYTRQHLDKLPADEKTKLEGDLASAREALDSDDKDQLNQGEAAFSLGGEPRIDWFFHSTVPGFVKRTGTAVVKLFPIVHIFLVPG